MLNTSRSTLSYKLRSVLRNELSIFSPASRIPHAFQSITAAVKRPQGAALKCGVDAHVFHCHGKVNFARAKNGASKSLYFMHGHNSKVYINRLHLTAWKNIDIIYAKWLDKYSELKITY